MHRESTPDLQALGIPSSQHPPTSSTLFTFDGSESDLTSLDEKSDTDQELVCSQSTSSNTAKNISSTKKSQLLGHNLASVSSLSESTPAVKRKRGRPPKHPSSSSVAFSASKSTRLKNKSLSKRPTDDALTTSNATSSASDADDDVLAILHTGKQNLKVSKRSPKRARMDAVPRTTAVVSQPPSDNSILRLLSGDSSFIAEDAEKKWSFPCSGEFVYVKLGEDGNPSTRDSQRVTPCYWWPAQCTSQTSDPSTVKVKLYGDDGHGHEREVIVSNSSYDSINAWSRINSGASHTEGDLRIALGRKELRSRFELACSEMQDQIKMHVGIDIVLPSQSLPVEQVVQLEHTSRHKRRKQNNLDPRDLHEEVDGTLDIPGERVYARMPRDKTGAHWPARVIAFSPKNPDVKRDFTGYLVTFLDDESRSDDDPLKRRKIRRSFFCNHLDENFLTVKLGEMETAVSSNHLPRDESAPSRTPTPEPVDPAQLSPQTAEDFNTLAIYEQFQYVQTIMRMIIQGVYEPLQKKHSSFVAGGTEREKIANSFCSTGGFSENELEHIRQEIYRWTLRDERKATLIKDDADPEESLPFAQQKYPVFVSDRNIHPPRPKGDACYEALNETERLRYCTDILYPEALVQLTLWRAGWRDSPQPLAFEQEQQLRANATERLDAGNWWLDLHRTRELDLQRKAKAETARSRARDKWSNG